MGKAKNVEFQEWNIIFLKLFWLITVLAFSVALVLYFKFDDVKNCPRRVYFMTFVAVPTLMQTVICVIMEIFVRVLSRHLPKFITAMVVAIGLEIQCGVIVMVHTSVGEMAVALVVPLVLSMVYNSRLILAAQSVIAGVIYVVTRLIIIPDAVYMPKNDAAVYIIIFAGLIAATVVCMDMLLRWQIGIQDEMELYRKRDMLQQKQVQTDSLTGIWNYKAFIETLGQRMDQLKKFPGKCVLVLLDIDGLYRINEKYGYICGDEVIVKLTEIIKRNVRSQDYLARYSGEEFMLILNEVSLQIAQQIAERIQEEFASYVFEQCDNNSNTVSIGIAEWNDSYSNNLDFVSKVEHALRLAKLQGYGSLSIYHENNIE